jgi:hypothetical protein
MIEDVLFTAGVTTLVGKSGKGKTTLAHSISSTVWIGGFYGGKLIEQRQANWIAGEGRWGLQPMHRAWLQEHPGCEGPVGRWRGQPANFYDTKDTDRLLRWLEGKPPQLITSDALSQMLAGNNENLAQDINKVYANVWRVVNYNGAAFVVIHHLGWEEKHERGSAAIRDNSDIVIQITEFNPNAGRIMLKHQKRREGPLLQSFGYRVKVPGVRNSVPICTGERIGAGQPIVEAGGVPTELVNAAQIVQIMVRWFADVQGVGSDELRRKFEEVTGLKRQTFYNAMRGAKGREWIVGDGPYRLNPNGCWMEAVPQAVRMGRTAEQTDDQSTDVSVQSNVHSNSNFHSPLAPIRGARLVGLVQWSPIGVNWTNSR